MALLKESAIRKTHRADNGRKTKRVIGNWLSRSTIDGPSEPSGVEEPMEVARSADTELSLAEFLVFLSIDWDDI